MWINEVSLGRLDDEGLTINKHGTAKKREMLTIFESDTISL